MTDDKSGAEVRQAGASLRIGGKSYSHEELSKLRVSGVLNTGGADEVRTSQASYPSSLLQEPKVNGTPGADGPVNETKAESPSEPAISAVARRPTRGRVGLGRASVATYDTQRLTSRGTGAESAVAKKWTEKAGQSRAQQKVASSAQKTVGGTKISDISTNMGLEAAAGAQNALSSSDDLGDQVGAGLIGAGTTTIKVAQAVSPAIKTARKVPETSGKAIDGADEIRTSQASQPSSLLQGAKVNDAPVTSAPINEAKAESPSEPAISTVTNRPTRGSVGLGRASVATYDTQRLTSRGTGAESAVAKKWTEKAGQSRAQQKVASSAQKTVGGTKISDISTNMGLEAAAGAQNALSSSDDLGDQVGAGLIGAGTTTIKVAQAVSPAIKTARKVPETSGKAKDSAKDVAKGGREAANHAGNPGAKLVKTGKSVSSGFVPIDTHLAKDVLTGQAYAPGRSATTASQRIAESVEQMRKTAAPIKTSAIPAAEAGKTVASKTATKGLNEAPKRAAQGAGSGAAWALKSGASGVGKWAADAAVGSLDSSDDMTVQGVGKSITLAEYGVKTARTGIAGSKEVVKTARGAGEQAKKSYNAVVAFKKDVKDKSLRAAWANARKSVAAGVAKSGKSVVSAAMGLAKAAGWKIAVIALVVVCGIVCVSALCGAGAGAVSSIFGGVFSLFGGGGEEEASTEMEVRTFVTDSTFGVPALRTAYINYLYGYIYVRLESNGGAYDYVRLKSNTENNVIEPTVEGISSVFYTEEEIANIIQPIFNAILLKDYELETTDVEARRVLEELFSNLFLPNFQVYPPISNESESIEWCGQAAVDGSGTSTTHSCGRVHALYSCPNTVTGNHEFYVCGSCCRYYYTCDGHRQLSCGMDEHTHGEGCYSITPGANGEAPIKTLICELTEHTHTDSCYSKWYHSGEMYSPCSNSTRRFRCNGYRYCGGHDVLTIMLNMDGLYKLLNLYFEKPINELSNKASRTADEEAELQELKDCYEICLEYISEVTKLYGGGMTMEDLDSTQWVRGSRPGDQNIVDIALSQVGQVGGQPYWSWYGFESHVEWCACFVSWCMNSAGHSEVRYSACQYGGLPYFKNNGKWADSGFTDLAAGDVIFFDWEQDGYTDHTGIVIGRDNMYIYTVEGNMGDSVQLRQYEINSSVISGFGLMS